MGEVIQLSKRNVQHASTEELKAVWDAWDGTPAERANTVPYNNA